MTDQQTNQNSDAGGEGEQQNAGGGGQEQGGGAEGSWLDQLNLPDDVRKHATVAKYSAKPEDMARALIHLEGHLGVPAEQLIRLPKPDDKDGIAALYDKLGRPENPDGYTAKIDGDQMDDAMFSAFKSTAHELGLSNAQVEGLAKWYGATGAQTAEQLAEADKAVREANETALKKELGGAYEETLQDAAAMAGRFGGEEYANYLKKTGLGNDPATIKAWAAVAKAMEEPGTPDPSNRGRDVQRTLTPGEAEAELAKMETDPAIMKSLTNATDPNHKFHNDRRLELIKLMGRKRA